MMKSKKWVIFFVLLSVWSMATPVLRAEDPQIPEAASSPLPEPEENPYGTLVLPPESEELFPFLSSSPAPSPESSEAPPAEMGTPVFEEEEEEEVSPRLTLNSQPD